MNTPEAAIGHKGTSYHDCVFDRTDFRKAMFIRAEFDKCMFRNTKSKGIDFNASSFVNCSFHGKLEDVWFRGTFPLRDMMAEFGFPRKNQMENINFEEASLWSVTFSNDCDLSTIVMPSSGEYRKYCNWEKRLVALDKKASELTAEDRKEAKVFASSHLVHARDQDWFILNCEEIIEEFGEQLGRWIIETLDTLTESEGFL